MLGRIFTVGGYTLLSRLTGLARDIMLAAILGAGPVADAFYVAWRLPNNFRAVFPGGGFNTLFMPQVIRLLAPGFAENSEQHRLAIELTRITFPYLLLITMVTLYGGMLNVMHRYASAAAASIFLNISMMT